MVQPNSSIGQLLTATIANYESSFPDNVTNNIPLLKWLQKQGNNKPHTGGTEFYEHIIFAEAAASGWYSGGEVHSTSQNDVMTTANFALKQHYALITMDGLEEMQNRGKEAMHSLLDGKLKAAEATGVNAVGASLFYSNTEQAGKAIGGFQHLIADDPTTGTVGGIDASTSTNSWWRNYVFDFSNNSLTASATTILTALNTSFLNTNRGNDIVDLVVLGTTYHGYFQGATQANQRFISAEKAQVGFKGYEYQDALVIHDPNCSATRGYGLNTKTMNYRVVKGRNFTKGESRQAFNQDAYAVPIYWAGNLTMASRKRNFVLIP